SDLLEHVRSRGAVHARGRVWAHRQLLLRCLQGLGRASATTAPRRPASAGLTRSIARETARPEITNIAICPCADTRTTLRMRCREAGAAGRNGSPPALVFLDCRTQANMS